MTVFLTTHYMEETEQSQKVCIIDSGKIIAEGTPHELRKKYSKSVLSVQTNDVQKLNTLCRQEKVKIDRQADDDTYENNPSVLRVKVDSSEQAQAVLNSLGSSVKILSLFMEQWMMFFLH